MNSGSNNVDTDNDGFYSGTVPLFLKMEIREKVGSYKVHLLEILGVM